MNYDIVIPTHRTQEATKQCLNNIACLMSNLRIILIDNGNEEDFFETPWLIRIPSAENLGFIKATNMGIARSTAPYIVLQNSDTLIFNNIYDKMAKVFEQDSQVGVVGTIFSPSPCWQSINNLPQWGMDKYRGTDAEIAAQISKDYAGQWQEVGGMVAFACVMIKREVIQNCGYLSERFGVGFGDDDEYCWRVQKAGYKVAVAKDCYIWHGHRTTFKQLYSEAEIEQMGLDNIRLFKKMTRGEI